MTAMPIENVRTITKDEYVKRIRQMIELEHICSRCPMIEEFYLSSGGTRLTVPEDKQHACKLCRDFIDLPVDNITDRVRRHDRCPCIACNNIDINATERTKLAIKKWDIGFHKWQHEDKEIPNG